MLGPVAETAVRIAFLLPTFPELSNTFILNQITGLLDRGHDVDLFAIGARSFEGSHDDVVGYRLAERMRHLRVPQERWGRLRSALALLLGPGGRHPAALDALNPFRHGKEAWNLTQLHTAASFWRSGAYDVLHCQFGHLGPAAVRLVALGAVRARLVTSFRGADLTVHVASQPKRFRELFRRGDLFLPVSQDFASRLMALGVAPDRVIVHHSGIDVRRFDFQPRVLGEGPAELLFVGRLSEKKGVAYALEAVAKVVASGRDARFTVIGEGPLGASLRGLAGSLGIADRVSFLGRRTQAEVVTAMRSAHLLLAPSMTAPNGDQEGIPNVVKEAMASGLPVVSTLHSGIPELVEHGVSGLLARERDAAGLASHLTYLLDHPEVWPAFGAAGRRTIEREFDSDRLNDELVGVYRQLMA